MRLDSCATDKPKPVAHRSINCHGQQSIGCPVFIKILKHKQTNKRKRLGYYDDGVYFHYNYIMILPAPLAYSPSKCPTFFRILFSIALSLSLSIYFSLDTAADLMSFVFRSLGLGLAKAQPHWSEVKPISQLPLPRKIVFCCLVNISMVNITFFLLVLALQMHRSSFIFFYFLVMLFLIVIKF